MGFRDVKLRRNLWGGEGGGFRFQLFGAGF